ncbi:tripeptidyl-peptidase 2-like [Musca autumnalis]|uniref:tripeptidyl-peptidase 2-like n=1 Tax=Musca autumnalis TaxID=221902 RepID=UPI003CE888F1
MSSGKVSDARIVQSSAYFTTNVSTTFSFRMSTGKTKTTIRISFHDSCFCAQKLFFISFVQKQSKNLTEKIQFSLQKQQTTGRIQRVDYLRKRHRSTTPEEKQIPAFTLEELPINSAKTMTKLSIYSGVVETPFPTAALVPKAETNVLNFLQKYPEYDGRDVTIAIFDSGVDPRATGLETLCDGKTVKVIERFDCTGCGDVNVTKKVTPDDKGFITGLSGRQLKLTADMIANNTSPNGEFRLGLKRFYDLCPSKVRENLTNARKLKEWDGPHKTAIAEISRKINEFEAQNPDTSKLSWDKKLIKEDLDNTLEMLNAYEKYYPDIKTAFDCILYETKDGWQACVDITEKGDLEKALHIGEYTKTHEIKNVDDYLSISINVHDGGDVLEIVGMCCK